MEPKEREGKRKKNKNHKANLSTHKRRVLKIPKPQTLSTINLHKMHLMNDLNENRRIIQLENNQRRLHANPSPALCSTFQAPWNLGLTLLISPPLRGKVQQQSMNAGCRTSHPEIMASGEFSGLSRYSIIQKNT